MAKRLRDDLKQEEREILFLKIEMMRNVLQDVRKLRQQINERIDNVTIQIYRKRKTPMDTFRESRLIILMDLQAYLPALKLSEDTEHFEDLIAEYEKQLRALN